MAPPTIPMDYPFPSHRCSSRLHSRQSSQTHAPFSSLYSNIDSDPGRSTQSMDAMEEYKRQLEAQQHQFQQFYYPAVSSRPATATAAAGTGDSDCAAPSSHMDRGRDVEIINGPREQSDSNSPPRPGSGISAASAAVVAAAVAATEPAADSTSQSSHRTYPFTPRSQSPSGPAYYYSTAPGSHAHGHHRSQSSVSGLRNMMATTASITGQTPDPLSNASVRETMSHVRDFSLLAEAARRAEMALMVDDLGNISL